ncbi:hypothetical protein KC19_11G046800 [Ceratodon purpureus]|uniref:Centrosomal protein of 162 kDa n=1 Tax=Ceratodon purpureus TaxID=3225 RepID=A0A8T0GB14_CERPU|nr:hypothetical protein KC19_11G046800 [Ceratodon purpureus]
MKKSQIIVTFVYKVENEKAVAKLKEVQLETKQRLQEMAEEKAYLASQLANRHIQRYGTDSDSLHEKLQNALSRETALRIDLDKMRDSYSELEKRVNREESSRMKDLELKLKTLHETLEAERQSHAQMEGRKQAMIQQEELIASLQETVSDQASKIRALTTMLEGGEGQGKNSVSENLDKKEAQQQIETLQAQVKKLEQSLRAAKKETGLQVTKSGMEENETFRRMQAELVAVQRQAHQKEEETNRIIHHLKVENEKIKHESVTRIRNLKQQIQTRAQSDHSISESELSAVNRVKDLEKQLANLRIHYSRKVKELSEKLEEASKPKLEDVLNRNKTLTSSMAPPSRVATTRLIQPAQGKALREAKERIALQEDVISQKDRTIKSLQTQLQEVESNRAGPTCTTSVGPSPVPSMVQGEVQTKPGAQERHSSSTSEQESMNLRNKGTRLKTGTNMITNDIYATDEVVVLRRELEKSELTREVLQKACNESVEKAVLLTLQHQQAQQLQQIRQSQMKHHRSSECQTPLAGAVWKG